MFGETDFNDPSFDGSASQETPDFSSQGEEQGGAPSFGEAPERTDSDPQRAFQRPEEGSPQTGEDHIEVPNVGRVPREELVKGYLRMQDYTRKTQQLGSRAREIENWQNERQAYDQTLTEIRAFLQDPQRLTAYLAALTGGQAQGQGQSPEAEIDPDAIVTAKEAQALIERATAQRIREVEGKFAEQLRDQQVQAFRAQYSEAVDNKLAEIARTYPELRQIPGMDTMLREAVRSRSPKTIQEALSLFEQAAKFYSSRFDQIAKARIASTQGRTNPVNRGIEPPNGRVPMPKQPATDDTQFSGVKDPALRNLVMQDLTRILSAGRA